MTTFKLSLILIALSIGLSAAALETTIRVELSPTHEYGDFLQLWGINDESNPGRIEDGQMKGIFSLLIGGDKWTTPTVAQSGNSVNTLGSGKYELVLTTWWSFQFLPTIEIQSVPKGPTVAISSINIAKSGKWDEAIVSLGSMKISSTEKLPPKWDNFQYPSDKGVESVELTGSKHPKKPLQLTYGYFLASKDNHLFISFGLFDYIEMGEKLGTMNFQCSVSAYSQDLAGSLVVGTKDNSPVSVSAPLRLYTQKDSSPALKLHLWDFSQALPKSANVPAIYAEVGTSNILVKAISGKCYCLYLNSALNLSNCLLCECTG